MKHLLTSLYVLVSLGLTLVAAPVIVSAQGVLDPVCVNNPQATLCKDNATKQSPDSNSIFGPDGVVTKIAGIIALVTGIASVLMIIIGAIQYAISGGDPARLNRAKDTILFALIGLMIALLARLIISFVLNKL